MKSSASPAVRNERAALQTLLERLHLYIGLLVGPFLLIAALSGIAYALTPQLEDLVYRDQLFSDNSGPARPLAEQVAAARAYLGDDAEPIALRPALPGGTTRVQFAAPGLRPSESRAVFIDPATAEVRGDLVVYGTSGVLPLRGFLDHLHRSLQLGAWGRAYAELAASWLWLAALGGLTLWYLRRRRGVRPRGMRRWHSTLGLWALLGLAFFSATGLTWSEYAGGRIGQLRHHYGWSTPSVNTALHSGMPMNMGEHAEHMGHMAMPMARFDDSLFDRTLATARAHGIEAQRLEIRPGAEGRAWSVTEIDRSWPTQVDAVAIDPQNLQVIDQVRFEDYPLAAKLTRWGIDLHMGVLFGLVNQLALIAVALALVVMTVWGYRMWWQRRPLNNAYIGPWRTLAALSWPTRLILAVVAAVLGWCLPVLGVSLLVFLAVDAILAPLLQRRSTQRTA